MSPKHLWLCLMGLVTVLGLSLCLYAGKRTMPTHQDWGLIIKSQEKQAWMRPITSAPGLNVVQIKGEMPGIGAVLTCQSSTHFIGKLENSDIWVVETLLACTGDGSEKTEFRVVGVTLGNMVFSYRGPK